MLFELSYAFSCLAHVNVRAGEGVAVLLYLLNDCLLSVPVRLEPDADVLKVKVGHQRQQSQQQKWHQQQQRSSTEQQHTSSGTLVR